MDEADAALLKRVVADPATRAIRRESGGEVVNRHWMKTGSEVSKHRAPRRMREYLMNGVECHLGVGLPRHVSYPRIGLHNRRYKHAAGLTVTLTPTGAYMLHGGTGVTGRAPCDSFGQSVSALR